MSFSLSWCERRHTAPRTTPSSLHIVYLFNYYSSLITTVILPSCTKLIHRQTYRLTEFQASILTKTFYHWQPATFDLPQPPVQASQQVASKLTITFHSPRLYKMPAASQIVQQKRGSYSYSCNSAKYRCLNLIIYWVLQVFLKCVTSASKWQPCRN